MAALARDLLSCLLVWLLLIAGAGTGLHGVAATAGDIVVCGATGPVLVTPGETPPGSPAGPVCPDCLPAVAGPPAPPGPRIPLVERPSEPARAAATTAPASLSASPPIRAPPARVA
jgi:hypothetical protein